MIPLTHAICAQVDVKGLKHSTQYYYMFALGGARSPLGKFRLPPPEGTSLDTVRYGVYTCSSWGWGYFNAYDYGAQLDLDFWMHMGDYIYGAPSCTPLLDRAPSRSGFLILVPIPELNTACTSRSSLRDVLLAMAGSKSVNQLPWKRLLRRCDADAAATTAHARAVTDPVDAVCVGS